MAGIVPNVSMLISGGGGEDTRRRPYDWRAVSVHNISIESRHRSLDQNKVEQLCESIKLQGLLEPIGVKQQGPGEPLLLIYGYHRLEAARLLVKTNPTLDVIAAVIYPQDMPAWACEMAEVAENLLRKELTAKEREAHTTIYAGMLKKHGNVVEGGKASGHSRSKDRQKPLASIPPTVTRKTAADLGISDVAVRNRVRNASKLASRGGYVPPAKPTPEAMSGDQLIDMGRKARDVAEADKAEAARLGKAPRNIKPHAPAKATIATVRLDVTDPAPFIEWCRKRIAGKHKPMSVDILKSYAAALADLIKEVEAN